MSLMTTAYLMDRFGPLLTTENLADVLRVDVGTIRNQRSANTLELAGIKQGRNVLYHAEDVAAYIDSMRKAA